MRDIEFRGKQIGTEEWIFGNLIREKRDPGFKSMYADLRDAGKSEYYIYPFNSEDGRGKAINPKTVGEYTGFCYGTESEKTKIFENDIIRSTNTEGEINKHDSDTGIGAVEWLDDHGFWNVSGIENGLGDLITISENEIKVIGNKTDNPELLDE